MNVVKRIIGKIYGATNRMRSVKYQFTANHYCQTGEFKFYVPSRLCRWRVDSLFTKEPGTIEWINSFESDSVFWDIGANIGLYSLYAAQKRKAMVYAFEPSPFNYNVLTKNIYLNNYSRDITALCMALTDSVFIGDLNLSSVDAGAAQCIFDSVKNEFNQDIAIAYPCKTLGISIDKLRELYNLRCPQYMKIDVDGAEDRVLFGAKDTLKDKSLQSILIELTADLSKNDSACFDRIIASGFHLVASDHPDGDKRLKNYIFSRS